MQVKLSEDLAKRLAEVISAHGDRIRDQIDVSEVRFPDYRMPDINTLSITINGRAYEFDLSTLDPEHDCTLGAITDLLELVAKMHLPEPKEPEPPDTEPDPVRATPPRRARSRR